MGSRSRPHGCILEPEYNWQSARRDLGQLAVIYEQRLVACKAISKSIAHLEKFEGGDRQTLQTLKTAIARVFDDNTCCELQGRLEPLFAALSAWADNGLAAGSNSSFETHWRSQRARSQRRSRRCQSDNPWPMAPGSFSSSSSSSTGNGTEAQQQPAGQPRNNGYGTSCIPGPAVVHWQSQPHLHSTADGAPRSTRVPEACRQRPSDGTIVPSPMARRMPPYPSDTLPSHRVSMNEEYFQRPISHASVNSTGVRNAPSCANGSCSMHELRRPQMMGYERPVEQNTGPCGPRSVEHWQPPYLHEQSQQRQWVSPAVACHVMNTEAGDCFLHL